MKEIQMIVKELLGKHEVPKELLAAKLGMHSMTIRNYLSGKSKPKLPVLEKLRRILNGYRNK